MNLGEFEDSETLSQEPAHNMPHHLVHSPPPRLTPPERRELDGIGGGGNGRSDLTNSATPQTPRNRPLSMSERSRMKLCYSPTTPAAPTTPKATRLPSSLVHDPTFHVGRRVCYALRGDMLSPIAELNLKKLGQYFLFS